MITEDEEKKVVIRLSGVKKQYKLGQIGIGTLQGDLQSWWAGIRGRDNPNSPLFQEKAVEAPFWALNGIDLTIYEGEAIGIIGLNGAGKSTLLKLISRITAPTEGDIDLYGRVSSMLEVGTGFNGQMTGRENVFLNGAILGMKRAEIERKLPSIIEFSEVEQFIDTPVKRYSSGMYVKLAFAVAAHLDSEILIMDEVLAVGDVAFQKKCLDRMRALVEEDCRTVLYVSHNMNTIRELCDRCVVLDQGRIIFDGDVEEAIHIYMNQSGDSLGVDFNLLEMKRSNQRINMLKKQKLQMRGLHLSGKKLPIYDHTEDLLLQMEVDVLEDIENVRFRLTTRTESDQAVGTVWSVPVNMKSSQAMKLEYRIPLGTLAKGKYYMSIGFYQFGDNGKMMQLDHITRAFQIEVTCKEAPIRWSSNTYGSIRFPEIEGKIYIEGSTHKNQ